MGQEIQSLKRIEIPTSLREIAFKAIKEAIINDELNSQKLYNEAELALELGISRTPVHEALLRLEDKGYVVLLPRKGFKINTLQREKLSALYSYRIILETAVIRHIIPKITVANIQKIEDIARREKQMAEKDNWKAFLKINGELHHSLALLTQNEYIISALENVRDLIHWAGAKTLAKSKERTKEVVKEHNAVIEMIKKHDVDGAVSKIEEHLLVGKELILEIIAQSEAVAK